MLRSMVVLLRI